MNSDTKHIPVIGTWWVVKTECPIPSIPGVEFYHFTEDGWCIWDTPLSEGYPKLARFRYRVTERGVSIGGRYEIEIYRDADDVVFQKSNGVRSWFRSMHRDERPLIMTDISAVDWAKIPSYWQYNETKD